MNEMLLLGAGASVEAGVPDTYGMTRKIVNSFREDPFLKQHAHVISFVIGGLLFQQGIKDENPLEASVNVEELFNAVQLLAERNALEAAPFVGSWHNMVQEFDKARIPTTRFDRLYRLIYDGVTKEILKALPNHPPPFAERDIDQDLEQAIKSITSGRGSFPRSVGKRIGEYVTKITKEWMDRLKRSIPHTGIEFDREFKAAIQKMKDRPGEGEIFSECADLMIRALVKIVWIDKPERVAHLKPLLSLLNTQKRLTIATLNYDNGIEQFAKTNGISFTTGIDYWSKSGVFDFSQDGISLIKLHGSIDWILQQNQQSEWRPMPHSVISRVTEEQVHTAGFRPAIIFGQKNKLTAEGPFLDLLRSFQNRLTHSTILTVVGYSFKDDHVNEFISQWLNLPFNKKMRIVSPHFYKDPNSYAKQLIHNGKEMVEIISETAGVGLAKLYTNSSM
jgi:hypothetical protein